EHEPKRVPTGDALDATSHGPKGDVGQSHAGRGNELLGLAHPDYLRINVGSLKAKFADMAVQDFRQFHRWLRHAVRILLEGPSVLQEFAHLLILAHDHFHRFQTGGRFPKTASRRKRAADVAAPSRA